VWYDKPIILDYPSLHICKEGKPLQEQNSSDLMADYSEENYPEGGRVALLLQNNPVMVYDIRVQMVQ
jgi:hypothetical protein